MRASNCDCDCDGSVSGRRHAELTEEQIAQRKKYREKVWELRSEFRKDVIDGDRIAALRDELGQMRIEMGLPERREKADRDSRRDARIPGGGHRR